MADAESEAAATIAAALEPLETDARSRVVSWMKDRYEMAPLMGIVNDMIWKEAAALRTAATRVIRGCPECKGKGELEATESGFKPRCGLCTPLREALVDAKSK